MLRKLVVLGVLVLTACNLPASGPSESATPEGGPAVETPFATTEPAGISPETSVPSETAASTPTTETSAVDESTQPAPGTHMLWIDGSVVVYVPGGPFTMGDNGAADRPEHIVTLPSYWIYKTEVTNAQYARCVEAGICGPPVGASYWEEYENPYRQNHPVVGVTWAQAQTYCDWVHAALPTEAQWEKAARGPEGRLYPWGTEPADCTLLNFDDCAYSTTPVSAYEKGKSYYEVYDMAGNVQEWVRDWYAANYYIVGPDQNPLGPTTGKERVVRGSAFGFAEDTLESALRYHAAPYTMGKTLGFRCVILEDGPLTLVPPLCRISGQTEDVDYNSCEPPYLTPEYNACDNGDAVWALLLEGNPNTTYDQTHSPGATCTFISAESMFYCHAASNLQASLRFCAHCDRPLRDEDGVCLPFDCSGPYEQDTDTCECVLEASSSIQVEGIPVGTGEEVNGDDPNIRRLLDLIGGSGVESSDCSDVTCLEGEMLTLGCECTSLMSVSCPAGWYVGPQGVCEPYEDSFDGWMDDWWNELIDMLTMDCPVGTTWDADSGCCAPPPETHWPCNGFMLANGVCAGSMDICVDALLIFPECATETPPPQCVNPSQYHDQPSCTSHDCKWVPNYTTANGGYCTYP